MGTYLIYGDSLKVLPNIKKEFDCVIVDPPYNTANKNTKVLRGRKNRTSDFGDWDYFQDSEYLQFTHNWIDAVNRKLKEQGNLILFCKMEYISDIKRIYENQGFRHHATIIWHKTNPAPSIRKKGFVSSCEAILWATKGDPKAKIGYTFNFGDQKIMHNFFESSICMGKERSKHPTQKPKKLVEHLVQIFSNENDWVLDCFAGSGTLADVCVANNRKSVSIEKDKEHYNIMSQRLFGVKGVTRLRGLRNIKI